jgi:NodT family efflux transporter outer membrane factor (OMF) lipoprotein
MRCWKFYSWCALLFLCSCYRNYEFHSSPYTLKCTDFQKNVEDAFETDSFASQTFPENWWELFEDPQLNQLITMSLSAHPAVNEARARVRKAAEESLYQYSFLLPHLDFDAEIFRRKVSEFGSLPPPELGIFTEAILTLTAKYELDIWRKNRSLYYSALDEVHAAIADRRQIELDLSTSIAAAYFDLQSTLLRKEIAEKRLIERKETYDLIKEKYGQGIISEFIVNDTDIQMVEIQDQIEQLEDRIQNDFHALQALSGNVITCVTGECFGYSVPSARFLKPFPLPCSLPLDLLARRPEISAQKWRIQSACYQIQAAKADFYPNINLLGYLGFQSFRLEHLFQAQSLILLADAALNLPLFDAGKRQAKLGIQREEFEIEVETYNQFILNAVQEVSDAMTNLMTSDQRLKIIRQSLRDAENNYRLSRLRFENGIDDYIQVLYSLDTVLLQQDLEAQIQLSRWDAIVDLIEAIGGGYDECR